MMNNDLTVLVSSCDKYEDAWEPFFRLCHIMGADKATDNPFVLNTETKKYECDFMKVVTINSDVNLTWSQRMMNVLNHINTEFIFFLLEDFFIMSPFNLEQFEKVIKYMRENKDVGVIHTTPTGKKYEPTEEMFFERKFEKNNICCTAVLWRKDFLQKLLREHENIWQFEWYSGIRAKMYYSEKVMQYNEMYPVIFDYRVVISDGYGITESKWLPKNKELFEKYGIEVDFDNLGWYVPHDKEKTKKPIIERVINHFKVKNSKRKSLK